MALNPKIMAKAQLRLDDLRESNKAEHESRLSRVYARVSEIARIDAELQQQMISLARLVFSGDAAELEKLKNANLSLQMRRAELLVENGFPRDYLDPIVSCPLCGDSGSVDGRICSCLRKLYNKELTASLSTLLRSGDESFEAFNLSLYPAEDRQNMSEILSLAKEFCQYFPDVDNLLFRGAPGLGKTFLSACIAREIAEKGWSVYYESAISAFKAFDDAQFRSDAEAASRVERMLDCDLLILDDLGTELLTPSVTSALYNLINTRLNAGKPIILNTNLNGESLLERYSPAIASRLNGYFTPLTFSGKDIRIKKLSNSAD